MEAAPRARLHLVGQSFALLPAFRVVARIVDCDAPVLILGERGTGKSMLAQLIHAHCAHGTEPFHLADLAADPNLEGCAGAALAAAVEPHNGTEARGRGRARQGTIFFREIESATLPSQARIAALLRERTGPSDDGSVATARRIMLSSRALADPQTGASGLLPELLPLLDMVTITLPPLRERGDDIVLLARHFAAQFAALGGRPAPKLPPETIDWLRGYPWPGNVAELRAVMQEALKHASDGQLLPEHLSLGRDATRDFSTPSAGATGMALRDLRRRHIARALFDSGGDVEVAARMLGMRQPVLARILRYSETGLGPLADGVAVRPVETPSSATVPVERKRIHLADRAPDPGLPR